MVAQTWGPRTPGTKVGGYQVQGQPGLHEEFKPGLIYRVKLCFKKKKKKKKIQF